MAREDLINHIDREAGQSSNWNYDEDATPILCQHCGNRIIAANTDTSDMKSDYIVHCVPEHGGQEMKSVFYCSRSCFDEAMSDLFSMDDEIER